MVRMHNDSCLKVGCAIIYYDYDGRLTRAKTKALTSYGKNVQGFVLEKQVVQ